MSDPTRKQASIIPDYPRDATVVDKDGQFTASYKLFFEQLTQALQLNLKAEGFVMPQQIASNITLLTGSASLGNILYDSTNNVFKGNLLTAPSTYTWKTFTMS